MKLLNYVLIALLLIISILAMEELELSKAEQMYYRQFYYDRITQNAIYDAANCMKLSLRESSDDHDVDSAVFAKIIVDGFIASLANSLQQEGIESKQKLETYIPFILVGDQEGYYIYTNYDVDLDYQKKILPKMRFLQKYGDEIYFFKGNDIGMFNEHQQQLKLTYYSREECLNREIAEELRIILSSEDWQEQLRKLKRSQMERDLSYFCNLYQQHIHDLGLYYHFDLVALKNWQVDVNQPFILAAVEGLPLVRGHHYSKIITGSYNAKYSPSYCGFFEHGIKYYLPITDQRVADIEEKYYFISAFEAAAKGYFPYD